MMNYEASLLQSKLDLAEKRMISSEPNVSLTEARSRLQAKYDDTYCPNITACERLRQIATKQ
ncbi:MAG: hypothetical protein ACI4YB_12620 [Oscillospiraceae bacterium]